MNPNEASIFNSGNVLTRDDVDRMLRQAQEPTDTFVVPQGVTSIEEDAFYDCTGLTSVTIPSSVIEIGEDAFDFCGQLTATVQPGSYAEAYYKENNIKYTYVS